jgi:hypothetical protein
MASHVFGFRLKRWRFGGGRRADQPPTNRPSGQLTLRVGTLINERFVNPRWFS